MPNSRFKDDLSCEEKCLYQKIRLVSAALGLGAFGIGAFSLTLADYSWLRWAGLIGGGFFFLISAIFNNARHFSMRIIWSQWARRSNQHDR